MLAKNRHLIKYLNQAYLLRQLIYEMLPEQGAQQKFQPFSYAN